MATSPVIPSKGLHTADSPLSQVPEGSFAIAENVVAQFNDVIEPMRGQGFLRNGSGEDVVASAVTREGVWYRGNLLLHSDNGVLARWDGSALTAYSGTHNQPDVTLARMRFLEVQKSLYFNTATGQRVIDSPTATPMRAGVSRVPMVGATGAPASAGAVPPNSQVAHRVLWSRRDGNDTEHVGPPSPRVVSVNHIAKAAVGGMVRSGSTVTVTYTGTLPLSSPSIEISPGEANFPAGIKTVTGTGSGTFTYTEAGAATSSTLAQQVLGTGMNVELDFLVPWDARPGDLFKVFRSFSSAQADVPPDDELFQSAEGVVPGPFTIPTSSASRTGSTVTLTITAHGVPIGGQVRVTSADSNFNPSGLRYAVVVNANTLEYSDDTSTGALTNTSAVTLSFATYAIVDNQPEALLGAPLYTNPNTGDGPLAARFQPPICRDMCFWQGRSVFINTEDVHRFGLTLLGADDIQAGDDITIDGIAYIAGNTGQAGFFPETGGTPGTNITATVASLARAICLHSSSNLVAYVDEDDVAIPGRITLERRIPGGSPFTVHASRPSSWAPALTTSSSGALASKADRRPNGVSFTPEGIHQGVPLPNWEPVGPDGVDLVRAVPLRDKLWLFAANGRIYTMTGRGPFRIDEFDGTATLLSADSAVAHSNQIFCFTSQGIVSVSDAGVRILSKDIETELLPSMARHRAAIGRYAFGVSYESDRQYILGIPEAGGSSADIQYVYNSATGKFTRWRRLRTWGRVHPTEDKLYMGEALGNKIRVERKQYKRSDYVDEEISGFLWLDDGVYRVTGAGVNQAGDVVTVGDETALIARTFDADVVELSRPIDLPFGAAACVVGRAYEVRLKGRPILPNGPMRETHFGAATFHFGRYLVHSARATFDTEKEPEQVEVPISHPDYILDARDIFNDALTTPRARRVDIPCGSAAQLRTGLVIREAFAMWSLHGHTLEYEAGSERTGD